MKGSIKLGKIAGIGLFIHWTFAILLLFIVLVSYRADYNVVQIIWSLLFVFAVFLTVLLHELGHALTAKQYKINTKDITLLPIGGVARLENIPEKALEEITIAIAGPIVNVAIAMLVGILVHIPDTSEEWMTQLSDGIRAENFMLNFFLINIWIAIFNLIPAFPMDGGRVLRGLLALRLERGRATRIAARIGQAIALVFMAYGFFENPFLIFIGLFVLISAQVEADFTQSKTLLKGYKVKDVLMYQFQTIRSDETIKSLVNLLLDSQYKHFLIVDHEKPVGTLNRDEIIKALSERGEKEPVKNIMNTDLIYLKGDAELDNVFEKIYENKTRLMLVMEDNHLIGTLDTENLMDFILVKDASAKSAMAEEYK